MINVCWTSTVCWFLQIIFTAYCYLPYLHSLLLLTYEVRHTQVGSCC
jgi:hypothetical protein